MSILSALNRSLQRIILKILGICLFIMLLSIIMQVTARELTYNNFDWVIEANRILFVWISYLGAAYGFAKCTHIRVEFIFDKFSPRVQKYVTTLIHLLNCCFFLVMGIYGYDIMLLGSSSVFATMNVSYLWLYMPICIFAVISILFTIENIALELRRDLVQPKGAVKC